jgi:voltage-gated potassium channel
MEEDNKLVRSNKLSIIVSSLIIASVLVVFIDVLFPLTEKQRMVLSIFDLVVVVILGLDFVVRLKFSKNKSKFILRHLYEIPAMIPLFVTGTVDSSSLLSYIRLIALFRVVRLYNIMSYVDGNEFVILASMSAVSIIFGGFAIYIAEAGHPDASINNIGDAMWWSIETITTVAYGEYYPITSVGRIIASVMMFAAIAFLWTLVGLVGSRFVAKRITKKEEESRSSNNNLLRSTSVVDETKTMIKKKIDDIENLGQEDLEALVTIIRSLNGSKKK